MNNTVIQPSDVTGTRRRAMLSYKHTIESSRRPNFAVRYNHHEELVEGKIYRATYAATGKAILIKGSKNLCMCEDDEIHCITEPYILQLVLGSHPNIVVLLEVLRAPNNDFVLEFEYCHGGSLLHYLLEVRGKSPTPPIIIIEKVARNLAEALTYCHTRSVVHRDIKMDNILVSPTGFRLADFGSACILEEGVAAPQYEVNPVGHRPPEILLGLAWSFSVDIWSLGCTLVEAHAVARGLNHPFLYDIASPLEHLRRVCEFAGPVPEIMFQAAGVRDRFPTELKYDFPELAEDSADLYKLVRKMLVTEPSQRLTATAAVIWTSHRPVIRYN